MLPDTLLQAAALPLAGIRRHCPTVSGHRQRVRLLCLRHQLHRAGGQVLQRAPHLVARLALGTLLLLHTWFARSLARRAERSLWEILQAAAAPNSSERRITPPVSLHDALISNER